MDSSKAKLMVAVTMAAALAAGCGGGSKANGPTNTTIRQQGADPYDNLMHECNLLTEQEMLSILGMKRRYQSFNGAVCRYDVSGGASPLEVTFYWFETGSLDREEEALKHMKYEYQWRDFDGQQGIIANPPGDKSTCGVIANSQSKGIIGWWVQPAFGNAGDSCDSVVKLMIKALNTRV